MNVYTYRGYQYDKDTGFYYLQSRYYDPEVGRFLNADDTNYLGASGTTLGYNLYSYCESNPVIYVDYFGNFSIPSFSISIAIDAIVLWAAGHFQIVWLGYFAPIKLMAKKAAAAYFTRFIAPVIVQSANTIINIGVSLLKRIGETIMAASFNLSAKMAIAGIINEPLRAITAITSVGGLIAAIVDYYTDKKFDGWIKLW